MIRIGAIGSPFILKALILSQTVKRILTLNTDNYVERYNAIRYISAVKDNFDFIADIVTCYIQ